MSDFPDEEHDHNDELATCPTCGAMMQWESCWACLGDGGHHDCGEDTCVCLDKEEITVECDECDGMGGYLQCSALPHKTPVEEPGTVEP